MGFNLDESATCLRCFSISFIILKISEISTQNTFLESSRIRCNLLERKYEIKYFIDYEKLQDSHLQSCVGNALIFNVLWNMIINVDSHFVKNSNSVFVYIRQKMKFRNIYISPRKFELALIRIPSEFASAIFLFHQSLICIFEIEISQNLIKSKIT